MTITLEQIDELRKRANVSFEDAREALEKCEGNLVEALVYLEKNKKIKSEQAKGTNSFFDKLKALIKRGNATRFIIWKSDRRIINLSVTASVIIGVLTFHVSALILLIALLAGYRFKFEKENGEGMKVNETLNKVHDNIDDLKRKFAEDENGDSCTQKL